MLLTCFALASNLMSQQVTESQWKRGYHGFNMIVEGIGLKHQTIRKWQAIPEKEKIIVLLGDVRQNLSFFGYFDIDGYLRNGGAMFVASDASSPLGRQGISFISGDVHARNDLDSFNGFDDCPIISDVELPIPNIYGLRMVTNRPGVLFKNSASPWNSLAYLPPVLETDRKLLFAAGGENSRGGKLICFSDQSVFSNQMLMYGDNAMVAKLSLQYLVGLGREYILVIGNGEIQQRVNPADLNVNIPQPTREEVVNALKDLPPSMLLEFANSVVGVVEDENMVNEYLNSTIDKIRPEVVNRFYIFLVFILACLVAMVTYIWQRKLMRNSTSDIARRKAERNRKLEDKINKTDASKAKLNFERQMAVLALLDAFCLDRVNRRFNDLASFPDEFGIGNDVQGRAIRDAMREVGEDYHTKPRSFWTKKRLLSVEAAVAHWRAYFDNGMPAGLGDLASAIVKASVVEGSR